VPGLQPLSARTTAAKCRKGVSILDIRRKDKHWQLRAGHRLARLVRWPKELQTVPYSWWLSSALHQQLHQQGAKDILCNCTACDALR
jgi:hypothetical protein